ncbi:hypothetical protein GCWU000182_00835 [Abiotrophia defectiva ATCC 49176]|uniref:Uncharacterized protein n=1 Tax=Abiotrophia defectiva ATCC 49176 TaxID=592010 RepID=W1Q3J5_ABIDE|nr:hypothetical protein GCWU000182_00835 [Abiotrophia defectiva ATCC 49176]
MNYYRPGNREIVIIRHENENMQKGQKNLRKALIYKYSYAIIMIVP